ncbi:MAG: Asp-tRNA(Asn)/Glu-tRNA(Gln) amidotransferase subunit GatB [bacterium]
MEYEVVIGLEVHAQLLTESKIFCGCPTMFGSEPNTQVCPVCLGLPGVIPVLNRKAVELALRLALATEGTIARACRFARKNYFYPDLPKGYQISQYEEPLSCEGHINIDIDGVTKRIGLTRIHLEEDAGKSIHPEGAGEETRVDVNRCGVPLVEIVTKPDLRSPNEAALFLTKLRQLVQYLDICDGNMEQGSLRCDANISVRPLGSDGLGVKAEMKNMNSIKGVQRALEFEAERQIRVLKKGGRIVQETMLWDETRGVAVPMRSKEEEHDYRYFPEPDLVALEISDAWIDEIRRGLPELPERRKERFVNRYGIPEYDAEVLTATKDLANYYEACVGLYNDPKVVSNWVMGAVLRALKERNIDIADFWIRPKDLADMLNLVADGTISGKMAKAVFREMVQTRKGPDEIVREKGLVQITDPSAIERIIDDVLQANKEAVRRYQAGKRQLFGYFVGQIMKATEGKANPKMVNEILRKKLEKSDSHLL